MYKEFKQFRDIPYDKQQELIGSVSDLVVEFGLEDYVKPEYARNTFCMLNDADGGVQVSTLKVVADVPFSKSDAVKSFNEKLSALVEGIEGDLDFRVHSLVIPGDDYQPFSQVVHLKGTDPVDLAYTAGQVWLVHFWTSWHPSCEGPMSKSEELLEKKGEEWGSNVKIVGVALDDSKDSVCNMVEGKGWSKVEQYHKGSSDCQKVYMGLRDVPFVVFIDKEGKLVQRGHPQERDLEKDLEDLLNGQALTGNGVAAAPWEFPAGYTKLDIDAIIKELTAFEAVGKELQDSKTVKAAVDALMRAQCTLTLTTLHDPKTKESKSKFVNERAMMGPTDKMDALNAILDEKVQGSFELVKEFTELNL